MIAIVPRRQRYHKVIYISEKGLRFRDATSDSLAEWANIVHIFRWMRFNLLVVIEQNGMVLIGNAFPDKTFPKSVDKVAYIWDTWETWIRDPQAIVRFEYPEWCVQEESRIAREDVFWGLIGGVVFLALTMRILLDENWRQWEVHEYAVPILGILIGLWGFWLVAQSFIRRLKKRIREISINRNGLRAVYSNGSIRELNVADIKTCRLENPRNPATVVFQGGTKLKNLDRFSHWPVLRGYLLARHAHSTRTQADSNVFFQR